MSAKLIITQSELVEIVAPYPEPRLVYQNAEPRKVNNLTLIDGKTFLSTTVAGDVMPPGAPDVGFFHDDTRFLSRLELRWDHSADGTQAFGGTAVGAADRINAVLVAANVIYKF